MVPVAKHAATAALVGAALTFTLVCCSAAGAEPATGTPTTVVAIVPTTSRPKPPVTVAKPRPTVLIGSAVSVQSSVAIQSVAVPATGVATPRALPHTGAASGPLAMLGLSLVLLGALATRGRHPQLRLSERS